MDRKFIITHNHHTQWYIYPFQDLLLKTVDTGQYIATGNYREAKYLRSLIPTWKNKLIYSNTPCTLVKEQEIHLCGFTVYSSCINCLHILQSSTWESKQNCHHINYWFLLWMKSFVKSVCLVCEQNIWHTDYTWASHHNSLFAHDLLLKNMGWIFVQ